MNTNVLTFLRENLQRLFTKSPLFFKVWMIISGALVLITGMPDFINMLSGNGFHIPDLWNVKVTNAVAWASRAALFMSLLTTQSKPAGITQDGTVIKTTDTDKLPFTTASEQKIVDKTEAPVIEVNTVNNAN